MSERFRELESLGASRRKDVVLLATVTSFDSLRHPRKSDLHQFAELFHPLFAASSDEARRQAAAILSRSPHVPASVALQIGSAPISIAAIFLTRAPSIDDTTLLEIIKSGTPAHATAIARRENLSVRLVDALVDRRQTAASPVLPSAASVKAALSDEARLVREDKLRDELKTLARQQPPRAGQPLAVAPLDTLHQTLLVRFARLGEINLFTGALADALACRPELAERMVLDVSGQQLATALVALAMPPEDLHFVLATFYPDLDERLGGRSRGDVLLASLTPELSRERLIGWLEADREDAHRHQPYLGPDRGADPRTPRPVKSAQRSVSTDRKTLRR